MGDTSTEKGCKYHHTAVSGVLLEFGYKRACGYRGVAVTGIWLSLVVFIKGSNQCKKGNKIIS